MKIGILTFHDSYNFGANLQVLATQSALLRTGVTPIVLNYRFPSRVIAYKNMIDPQQAQQHDNFLKNYLNLSPLLQTRQEVGEYCMDTLDAVIVGSDSVFRITPKYQPKRLMKQLLKRKSNYPMLTMEDDLEPYWLEWHKRADGTPVKATLAVSSRGTPFYFLSFGLYPRLWRSLRDFDYISVRDGWTRLLVWSLSLGTTKPVRCPDPVFSLNRNFVVPETEKIQENLSNTILVGGGLHESWVQELREEASKRGYTLGVLANPEDGTTPGIFDVNLGLPRSPLNWYSALSSAAGYIGERFHALISSMANCRPVVTVDVAKPLFRKYDSRNPNFDVCREAGTLSRYFLRREIEKTPPQVILDILLDSATNEQANRYSAWAADEVMRNVKAILAIAEKYK